MSATPFVTVTIGRNRRPGSKVAPDAPLTVKQWYDFRNDVLDALDEVKTPESWVETFEGRGEWKGVPEQRVKFTVYSTDMFKFYTHLMLRLNQLCVTYDQDVIEVGRGTVYQSRGKHV